MPSLRTVIKVGNSLTYQKPEPVGKQVKSGSFSFITGWFSLGDSDETILITSICSTVCW